MLARRGACVFQRGGILRSITTNCSKQLASQFLCRSVYSHSKISHSGRSGVQILGSHVQKAYNSINASTDGREIPKEILSMPIEKYHEVSDSFMENLLDQIESISDCYPEAINDVEMSQGVMNLEIPSVGTYVINKQPPNKQIWLASPVSGPNRFDYYQDEWVSLRDGTKLLDILNTELREVLNGEDPDLHY